MEAFPFSEAEWATVSDAALPVVNARLAEDAVLRASHLVGLFDVLAGLRVRHGDHPALLEVEADFTEDDGERVALYRRATTLAATNGLQTLTIRLSLAQVLLELGWATEAAVELSACESELPGGDDTGCGGKARRISGGIGSDCVARFPLLTVRRGGWLRSRRIGELDGRHTKAGGVTMLPIRFTLAVDHRGWAYIQIQPPYGLFGDFLSSTGYRIANAGSSERARFVPHGLDAIRQLLARLSRAVVRAVRPRGEDRD